MYFTTMIISEKPFLHHHWIPPNIPWPNGPMASLHRQIRGNLSDLRQASEEHGRPLLPSTLRPPFRTNGKFSHFAWDAVVVWKNGGFVKVTINAKFQLRQLHLFLFAKLWFCFDIHFPTFSNPVSGFVDCSYGERENYSVGDIDTWNLTAQLDSSICVWVLLRPLPQTIKNPPYLLNMFITCFMFGSSHLAADHEFFLRL